MNFKADFCIRGHYGNHICSDDTIEGLLQKLEENGFDFAMVSKQSIIDWYKTDKKRFYSTVITIERGETEMTEYTSF